MAHSRHVARLAGSIFAQLAERYQLDPADQALLEAGRQLAGRRLPDQLRPASQAQLSSDSAQPPGGFSRSELELIANVARYHRGADPKRKHANFRQLSTARPEARAADGGHPARGRRTRPQQHAAGDGRARSKSSKNDELDAASSPRPSFPKSTSGAPQTEQAVRKGVRRGPERSSGTKPGRTATDWPRPKLHQPMRSAAACR